MQIVKIFFGAFIFIALLNELIKMEIYGNDRISVVKAGLLMIFELCLLGE